MKQIWLQSTFHTQSLIWWQSLNPKLAKFLINPLSDIMCKIKPTLLNIYIDNGDIDIVGQ